MSTLVWAARIGLLFGLSVCGLAPGIAQPAEAPQEPPSRSAQHHETHVIAADGKTVSTFTHATQVRHVTAVEPLKQVTLSFSRSAQTLEVLEAYNRKPDGRRLIVPKGSWQVRAETGRQGAAPIFSDHNSITLVYPDVAVGDTLYLAYRQTTRQPMYPGKVSLNNFFPRTYAYDDVRITVDAPAGMPLHQAAQGMAVTDETRNGRRRLIWTLRQPVAAPQTRQNWGVFDADAEPGYAVSSFVDWSDIGRSYVERAAPKAAPTPRIRALAAEIVGTRQPPQEQAKALYDWVSVNISYAGNCVGIGAVVPRDLDVVLDHKMGDCKDHATLLQALLAARGITSHQALVNAGNVYRLPKVPVASTVNHVINYLPQLGLFADTTDGVTRWGRLPVQVQDKPVLAAAAEVPARTPADPGGNRQTMRTTLNLGDDGTASGKVEVSLTGLYADQARAAFRQLGTDQRNQLVRQMFRQSGLEAEGNLEHDDPRVLGEQFNFSGSFKVQKVLKLPGSGALGINPWFYNFAPVARFAQQATMVVEDVESACMSGASVESYTITLPATMQVLSVPQGTAFSNALISYESRYALQDRVLSVQREITDQTRGNICTAQTMREYKDAVTPVLDDLRQQLLYK